MDIKFKPLSDQAILPRRMTEGSIGLDIFACLVGESGRPNNMILPPRSTRNVQTGLLIEAPPGVWLAVCSRSGLAKRSIFVVNSPGIIDPDYRGELQVLLYNGGYESQWILHHDRIAQLIPMPALRVGAKMVDELSESGRGEAGFGSTGR